MKKQNKKVVKKKKSKFKKLIEASENKIPLKTLEDKNPFLIKSRRGGYYANEDLLARHLITKYDFKTIYGKKFDELYVSDGKIYRTEKAREVIKTECEKLVLKYCKTSVVNEVLEKIKRLTPIERAVFDEIPLQFIPLENGIYNIAAKKLISYNAKIPFRFIIPVAYNEKAACKPFLKFLEDTLYPEDVPVLQEWFGFNLYRQYFIKKGMIFEGKKDTGKTALINILIKFIGQENVTGINLQRITNEDKFALSSLYNKHSNIYDDLSSKDLNNGGGFKIATGGGYVTAEYKFGDSFQFKNFAKMLFACNKIPMIQDDEDEAYYFRWLPIEFLNQVPENEQDKFLVEKLTTKDNLSGILNWALEGLHRLLQNGRFSYNKTETEIKRIMNSGDNLKRFAEDCLKECAGQRISKEIMFELYTIWAKETGASRFSKSQLGRNLENSVKFIIAKHDSERFWENAKIDFDSPFFKKMESVPHKLDTLDVFKKTIRGIVIKQDNSNKNSKNSIVRDNIDMIFQNASKVSNPPPVVICDICKKNPAIIFQEGENFCKNCFYEVSK